MFRERGHLLQAHSSWGHDVPRQLGSKPLNYSASEFSISVELSSRRLLRGEATEAQTG